MRKNRNFSKNKTNDIVKKWREDDCFRQLVQKQHLDMTLNEIKHYGKNSKDENIAFQNFSKRSPLDSTRLNLDEEGSDSHFDSFEKQKLRDLNLPSANNSGYPTSSTKSNSNLNESKVKSPTKNRCEEGNQLYCVCQKKMTENCTWSASHV